MKSLTPEEQVGIVRFVYQLDAERETSGRELSALAERLVKAEDLVELRASGRRIRGFCGVERDA